MAKRVYNFTLPYKLSPWQVFGAVAQLKGKGLWEQLPQDLQDKLQHCADLGYGLSVYDYQLDEIDDKTWAYIADQLHLNWEPAPQTNG